MLQVTCDHPLSEIEAVLRRSAHRHEVTVNSVHHVGHLLRERDPMAPEDAFSFTICHHELYAGLLAADIRVAAFLPCRIAAYTQGGRVMLETISPVEFGRLLNRPDLVQFAGPLENVLRAILQDAAQPAATAGHPAAGKHRGGLGATEEQMNMRGSIPQRIDCHGTKVEEIAGTGEHDSQGG